MIVIKSVIIIIIIIIIIIQPRSLALIELCDIRHGVEYPSFSSSDQFR